MWMIKHWDELKRHHGHAYPLEKAVMDYSSRYGKNLAQRLGAMVDRIRRK
jgi:hypothetical protein